MNAAFILPAVEIYVDGSALAASNMEGLVEVRVQQRLSMPTSCELYLSLPSARHALDTRLAPGARLEVRLTAQGKSLFSGEITALEYIYGAQGKHAVVVRGYDLLHRLRKRQEVRAFSDLSLADIARQIAGGAGIPLGDSRQASRPYAYLVQHQQNDLEFLVELAAASGLYLSLQQNRLALLDLSGQHGPKPVDLAFSSNLLEARLEINADRAVPSVQAFGWDAARLELHRAVTRSARSARNVAASRPLLPGATPVPLLNQAAAYSWQASDLAQAEMDNRTASEICLWGRAVGDPELAPGVRVHLSDVEPSLEGTYVVTSALHRINSPGEYTTEIDTHPPELPSRPRSDVATIGVVTNVDDPTRRGRVRALLPAYDNVETGWMQVVIPGAGPEKGFISMPADGDNVLVLLTREDPARGLVLGGLYGTQQPPDSGVEGRAVERYTWITPGRQKIQLNDSGEVIRLENAAGSYIELAGDSITIAGNAIDFKRT